MPKRIVIIGAGPIGCYTAQLLRGYGYRPLVIEEHGEVGRPLHCTGLVGKGVFEEKRVPAISKSSVINTINGALIHYDNQSFAIERKNVAYVIDRERFDKELSRGAEILCENRFLGLEKIKSGYLVETDKGEFPADIVIGADGANSAVRKLLKQDANITTYKGLQLRIKIKPRHKDFVEVYLKTPYFYWVVPEAEDIVRVGTISESPHQDLQKFLKDAKIKGEVLERFGGLVCVGLCGSTVKENIALVGDAACQLKPLTYGGVYFGLKSALILASCIKEGRLEEYDSLWKKELASEIKIGLKVKQVYKSLSDQELKKLFLLLKSQKSIIEKIGDFENHSRLFLEIIKKPAAYPQIGELFQLFFKKILF